MAASPQASPPPERRKPLALLALLVIACGAAAYLVWFRSKPLEPKPEPDMTGAMAANLRGVGRMERFEYPEAEHEFAEAVRLAPDWLPARINLGIAMFNQQPATDKTLTEHVAGAQDVFREVLKRDPNNPHAHYCLGIIELYVNRLPEAHAHFQEVNKIDPDDPYTWLRLGVTDAAGPSSPAARECYEKALKLNPYLNEARYRLATSLREADPARRATLMEEHKALLAADLYAESRIVYGEMGKYGDVIGRDASIAASSVGPLPMFEPAEKFKVTLAPGTRWATAADLDPIRKSIRERFGGAIVLFDFNGDGKPDIFLASAVVENGRVRDLLLRNDGNGVLTDVTTVAGLATPRPSLGAAAGDFDNDGKPDLVITGAGEQHLFRNIDHVKFEDVSSAAGLDKVKNTCLGCGWLDLDQDGDLDLVLCGFGGDGGVIVFENVGIAPPTGQPNAPPPGLTTAFRRMDRFVPSGSTVGFLASDLDADRDVDLLLLLDSSDPVFVRNDRLMRFGNSSPTWATAQPHRWNGGLVLDANHDERSDLFLVRQGGPPVFLLSKGATDFTPGRTNSPELKQAVTADIDMDGWPDVVGLAADGTPVLLHNKGDGRLELAAGAFGPVASSHAIAVADLDGNGTPDLLTWGADGLHLHRNRGNGNSAVLIEPTGRRDKGSNQRTTTDGIGAWIVAQSGSLWTGAERTTLSSGPGQSLLPTTLGIGKHGRAEVVRIRWPDGVIQAELGVAANSPVRITETNRKGTSCPVLMAWDGEKFAFVTDFLGAGALGESGPDGSVRPPRPEESVKIEPGRLAPRDGQFLLKIAEPMDEVLYLDHLRLVVIDHPADVEVHPDERFVFSDPEPSQKLLAFRTRHFPKLAIDHAGRGVLPLLLDRDRRAVDGFATRSWLGYAEDHSLTLDFDTVPAGKWFLVLAGWTEYPYPESMYAATRAGVGLKPPMLEREVASGKWEPLCDLGFPAGLPRVMTRELPPDFRGSRLRISTNMQIFWDQVYLARAEDAESVGRVTALDVSRADLRARGFMKEVYPGGRPPVAYDDSKTEPVAVTNWKGNLTRLGDVTDLLHTADDRFVVCGPGDEITVRFDARSLPALPPGWQRSFVLRTRGYCKDTSVTTVTGGEVDPLPFRGMQNYPAFGATPPKTDADAWHTRPAGARSK